MMIVKELLSEGRSTLETAAIESASLDASLLLGHVLGCSREGIYARSTDTVDEKGISIFRDCIARRRTGYPVAYLLGSKEFRGMEFFVDERVLIPRPDTEILVEAALDIMISNVPATFQVLDVCTGSGCVGISLAAAHPSCGVFLADLSAEALELARANSRRLLGRELLAFHSDLLANVPSGWDMIVANPPYLTPEETASCLALGWSEPEMALNGLGADGLDVIRKLLSQAKRSLNGGGWLLIEAAPGQMPILGSELARMRFSEIKTFDDLSGRPRVIGGRYFK